MDTASNKIVKRLLEKEARRRKEEEARKKVKEIGIYPIRYK